MFYFLAPQVVDRQEMTFNTNCCTVFTGWIQKQVRAEAKDPS